MPSHAIIQLWLSPRRQIQKTSPSSLLLAGVAAADAEGEGETALELPRGEDEGESGNTDCLSFDPSLCAGVALGDLAGVLLSDSDNLGRLLGVDVFFAVPFLVDVGCGRFLLRGVG